MIPPRNRSATIGLTLALGVVLGWGLALVGPGKATRSLKADGADRFGDWVVASGAIQQESASALKDVIPQDAIYYLNYKTGHLLAGVPTPRSNPKGGIEFLSEFAERDLVADFGLIPGDSPHFLMTTARVGSRSEGWDPLFVFETGTGQVATYRVQVQITAGSSRPIFQLVERKTDPRLGRGVRSR